MVRNDFGSGDPSGLSVPRRISTAGGSARRSPETVLAGRVKVSCTASPACCATRSAIATGIGGEGGVGSPGAPQPAASEKTKSDAIISMLEIRGRRILGASGLGEIRLFISSFGFYRI